MFRSITSFSGRIRRLEYGLTLIGYSIISILLKLILFFAIKDSYQSEVSTDTDPFFNWLYLIALIPLIWIFIAQSSKRCHDLGKSGLWQLVPFYIFWLIFEEGAKGVNSYGYDPKQQLPNAI